jgi:hypothetical protein
MLRKDNKSGFHAIWGTRIEDSRHTPSGTRASCRERHYCQYPLPGNWCILIRVAGEDAPPASLVRRRISIAR